VHTRTAPARTGREAVIVTQLRTAVIGAGWIGRKHIAALAARDDVVIGAVCDVDADRARAAAEGTGARIFTDWREMLDAAAPEAVWVCTPPQAHLDPAVTCLDRGLHVYLEKPVARDLGDAAAIVDAAARSSAVCAVGYQWRGVEVLDAARAAMAGRPVGCLVAESVGGTESRPWFLDRAAGGGNLLERGSHHIDLARVLAGEVVSVQAAAARIRLAPGRGGDIEDAVTLLLHFADGGLGTIVVAWTTDDVPGSYWVEVVTEGGVLRVDLDPDFRLSGTTDGAPVAATSAGEPFARSIDRFLSAVRAGDPQLVFCTPADAERTLAVAVAAEAALKSGQTVTIGDDASRV
jgi:predicted dehydrogenase